MSLCCEWVSKDSNLMYGSGHLECLLYSCQSSHATSCESRVESLFTLHHRIFLPVAVHQYFHALHIYCIVHAICVEILVIFSVEILVTFCCCVHCTEVCMLVAVLTACPCRLPDI